MVRNVKDRSLKTRLIAAIRGQQALKARNGQQNAYIKLSTIYKVLKAENSSEKAQIRGILNRDHINGLKVFDRAPATDEKKRNGAYRIYFENEVMSGTVESQISATIETTNGLVA
jgi:hypothetical protein